MDEGGVVPWVHHLPRVPVVDRLRFLCSLAAGKRVIHVGFADVEDLRDLNEPRGMWLHSKLAAVAKDLTGIDSNSEAVARARSEGYEVFAADCSDGEALSGLRVRAELVIAGELIEHLDAPGAFLDAMHQLTVPSGVLVLTTPNAYSLGTALTALARREAINPDHVAIYSWYTLSNILRRHGWRVREFATYSYPKPGTIQGKLAFGAERLLSRWSPFVAHGLIAVCEPDPRSSGASARN